MHGETVVNEIWLARVNDALISTDEESLKFIRRMAPGECKALRPIGVRDPVAHRRYWAMCTQTAKNVNRIEIDRQDGKPVYMPIHNKNHAHTAFKLCTGLYDVLPVEGTDYAIRVPHSTSFEDMTPEAWLGYWPKVMEVLLERVAPFIEAPEAQNEMLIALERWQSEAA
jgi:hypothetical protein